MIRIENLQKSFGNNQVLRGITAEVKEGETLAVIGPSGSGKSTFLRCINLLETPDKGKVTIGTHSYDAEHLDQNKVLEIQRATAMVFQDYALFANYSVLNNIVLPLTKVRKIAKKEAEETAHELLVKVGLEDRENYYPSQLSGGQQQRVGIARALALNPDVILFDEPTSALDPELVQGVLDVMRDIAREKITSIVVTHEMAFARDAADHVIFMDSGRIVEEGSSEEVILNPKEERTRQFLSRFSH